MVINLAVIQHRYPCGLVDRNGHWVRRAKGRSPSQRDHDDGALGVTQEVMTKG